MLQGYVDLPLFRGLRYLRPFAQSAVDLSHNISNFVKVSCVLIDTHHFDTCSFLLLFVPCMQEIKFLSRPDQSTVRKWRMEAAESGLHVHISVAVPQTLEPEVANELRGLDLSDMRVADMKVLARIVGVPTSGRKAQLELRLAPILQSINGFAFPLTHMQTPTPIPSSPHT